MSALIRCQWQPSCRLEADFQCSCPFYFCEEHNYKHSLDSMPNHRSSYIHIKLRDEDLNSVSRISIPEISQSIVNTLMEDKRHKIQELNNKIIKIERKHCLIMKTLLQSTQDLSTLLSEIRNSGRIPRYSPNPLTQKVASLLNQSNLSSESVRELILKQLHAGSPSKVRIRPESRDFSRVRNSQLNLGNYVPNRREEPGTMRENKYHKLSKSDSSKLLPSVLSSQDESAILSIAVSPCCRFIASGSKNKLITIWDRNEKTAVVTLRGHSDRVRTVSFDPTSRYLVSGSDDKTAKIWDWKKQRTPRVNYCYHTAAVTSTCFSPIANSQLVATGSYNNAICLWRATDGNNLHTLNGHSAPIRKISFTLDGNRIISGSEDGKIHIWEIRNGQILKVLTGSCGKIYSFSLFGNKLACGGQNNRVELWDIQSGERTATLDGYEGYIYSIEFSADGKYLVSAGGDDCIVIRDQRQIIHRISKITSPKFVIAGNEIVSGDLKGKIRIYSLPN